MSDAALAKSSSALPKPTTVLRFHAKVLRLPTPVAGVRPGRRPAAPRASALAIQMTAGARPARVLQPSRHGLIRIHAGASMQIPDIAGRILKSIAPVRPRQTISAARDGAMLRGCLACPEIAGKPSES